MLFLSLFLYGKVQNGSSPVSYYSGLNEKCPLKAHVFEHSILLGEVMEPIGGRALLEDICQWHRL